jgi:hypothetical protein
MGMTRIPNSDFKYTDSEPAPVSLVYFNVSDKIAYEKAVSLLQTML